MPWGRTIALLAAASIASCEVGGDQIQVPPLALKRDDAGRPLFTCLDEDSVACERNVHLSCERVGEFLLVKETDCEAMGLVCSATHVCLVCSPGSLRCQVCEQGDADCDRNVVQRCTEEGDGWEDVETCDLEHGDMCYEGACENQCARARADRSYVGCEFFAVDLDNAAIDDLNNASAQQFAVAVANPQPVPVTVTVSTDTAAAVDEVTENLVETVIVPPGDLEVFELERREVDGSSFNGLNDGTHTAVTSNAYRVDSSHPIIAYQFNPLENVNVFSNDASLLLPTSALGDRYTVVGWPQTIGDSDNPDQDFDSTSSDEDLRAFLTIVAVEPDTELSVELGDEVVQVVGGGGLPRSEPGAKIDVTDLLGPLDPFTVVNLETAGFNADFTGTRIMASKPVSVFIGSEASDVPIFGTYATRQCCADHLEEQLFPDATLGTFFSIARMPSRTKALNAAAFEDDPLQVALVNEPEWVRVVATSSATTHIDTSLPFPDDSFTLRDGQDAILRADQDFLLQSDRPIAVLQALPSQGVTGIPRNFPGGDPAIIAVPPIEQYRRDYIFLTPDKYAFDFVTITATASTRILLDGEPLPDYCTTDPADGPASSSPATTSSSGDDPMLDRVIHRCQLSFPKVSSSTSAQVFAGEQHDGVHTIVADREVGIVVYGFDRFVSYAYAGGLNLKVLR